MFSNPELKKLQQQIDGLSSEIKLIAERQNSQYTDIMLQLKKSEVFVNDKSDEELYEEAKDAVIEFGKASTSFIQRYLRIGYSRAAKIMDDLEENGVIGPPRGSKPRKVIAK